MSYSDQINNSDIGSTLHDNWVDEQERQYEKRKELLAKFIDGGKRYNDELLFRNVIEGLVTGADPLRIIEKLMDMNKDLQN